MTSERAASLEPTEGTPTYGEDAERAASADGLSAVAKLCDRAESIAIEVAVAEEELKSKKEALRDLLENQIPKAMLLAGFKKGTLPDGRKLTIAENTYVSVPTEKRDLAFEWLEEHEHAGIIKRVVLFNVGRTDTEIVEKLRELVREKFSFEGEEAKKVEAGHLASLQNELAEAGESLPEEIFTVTKKKAVKITQPKTR